MEYSIRISPLGPMPSTCLLPPYRDPRPAAMMTKETFMRFSPVNP